MKDLPITETELALALEYNLVKRFAIEQTAHGTYRTRVTIKTEETSHEKILITQRKTPREWANADRLLRHVQKHFPTVETLTVILYKPQEQDT